MKRYTASVDFDKRLALFDIQGSLAHAHMLANCSIISAQDLKDIQRGLALIENEIIGGDFVWQLDLEDVHLNIEKRLTTLVGDAGKRLHTGRSHIANTIFQGMASRSGLRINNSYITNELEGMRIISPEGFWLTIPAQGYFIDRKKFDDFYIEMAREAGIALLRQEAIDLNQEGRHRSVITDQEEIEARVVIDASGIQPALAPKAGLLSMRHPRDIAWAIEALVEHPRFCEERYFEYFVGSIAPGWKATFSPAGNDRATLGVFVRRPGSNIYPFFKNFLNYFKDFKSRSLKDIGRLKVISKVCGGDPIAVLPGEIVSDGFMVTGGSAGQSGLAYGMRAGTICGEVAGDALRSMDFSRRFLHRYEKRWKSEFYWEYRLGRAALETLREMRDRELPGLEPALRPIQLRARRSSRTGQLRRPGLR